MFAFTSSVRIFKETFLTGLVLGSMAYELLILEFFSILTGCTWE